MTKENNMAGKHMDLTQQCIPIPSQSQSNHQDHQDRSSEDGASKSLDVLHTENQAERKPEKVLEVNKEQYLGIKRKPRMRTITPLVKNFQFSFDWDDIEDTYLDCESEENQAERKREKVLEVNKEQYLGIKRKPRMRTITPLVKNFQFSFDWDDIEDTYSDCESEEILMGTKA